MAVMYLDWGVVNDRSEVCYKECFGTQMSFCHGINGKELELRGEGESALDDLFVQQQ